MDVAGAALDGVAEDHVHQLDDGGLVRRLLQVLQVHLGLLFLELQMGFGAVEGGHHRFQVVFRLQAVSALDRVLNLALGHHHRLDVVAGHELDVVQGENIGGIGHGDGQRGAHPAERKNLVALGDFVGNELDDRGVDLKIGEIDGGNAVLAGDEVGYLGLRQKAMLDQDASQPPAGLPLRPLCL